MNRAAVRGTWKAARALIRKDVRAALPLLLGLGTIAVFGVLEEALFEPATAPTWVDAQTWGSVAGVGAASIAMITALLAALVLFAGDRDARTAEFVATLPVEPLLVVACKFAVIAGITVGFLWTDLLSDLTLTALLNPEPFAHRAITFTGLLWRFGLPAFLCLVWAAHAVWLSSFGRLGWVILALFTLGTLVLAELSPLLEPIGVDGLLRVQHHGTVPQFPWRAALFHGGLGAVTLVAGTRRWVRGHGQPPRLAVASDSVDASGARRARLWPALLVVGSMLLVGVIVILVRQQAEQAEEAAAVDEADEGPEVANDHLETKHFVFTFRPDDAAVAKALAVQADAFYGRVARYTGVEVPERIVADLTFSGVEAAGVALGYHLVVDVSDQRSAEDLQHIFMHELVHVFETALSGRARLDQRASLRFLAEGFAEHVAFALLERGHARDRAGLQAAWAARRYKLRLRDLFDASRFVAVYDERWLYDFGERWMTALAATCGRTAPAKMWRHLDDSSLPASLLGADLARVLLSRDRCDYDQVEAAYEAGLRAAEPLLAGIPRFRARFVERSSSVFSFDVQVDGADGDRNVPTTLVLRADVTTSPRAFVVENFDLAPGGLRRIKVDAPALDDRSFQYRVGIDVTNGGHTFTRWRSARSE